MIQTTRLTIPLMLLLLLFATAATSAQEELPDTVIKALQATPVHFTGRVMPIERASRIVVRRFSGRRSIDEHDQSSWLARVLLRPFSAIHDKAFLVDDPGALDAIGFPDAGRARYSYAELYPFLPAVDSFAAALGAVDRPLDATERAIVSLAAKITLFEGLASTLDVFRASEGTSEYEQWLAGRTQGADAVNVPGMLRLVPVASEDGTSVRWVTPARVLLSAPVTSPASAPEAATVIALMAEWNRLAERPMGVSAKRIQSLSRELAFTDRPGAAFTADVVYLSLWPRLLALGLSALLFAIAALRSRAVWGMAVVASLLLLVLTAEQTLRIVITGRPPVVTLGGALLFLSWAATLWVTVRALKAVGSSAATPRSAAGAVLPIVVAGLLVENSADPFAVVQAVLDTNVWLAVHIGTITIGYLAVIAAGCLSEWYLIREIRQPELQESNLRWYRRARVAALVALTGTSLGTLLGGFWADQSWGRFWGWDPKESGALLIILWLSLVLHFKQDSRWSRSLVAAGLVFGVGVLLVAWVGVNALGIGLHSYGLVTGSLIIVLAGVAVVASAAGVSLVLAVRRSKHRPHAHNQERKA